jgi:hypothetical protein
LEDAERLRYLLTYELARQCGLSLRAVELWRHAFDGLPHVPSPNDPTADPAERARAEEELRLAHRDRTELALLHAHAFLTHAANASKILWPPPPRPGHPYTRAKREQRARAMRAALSIPDESPLAARDLRNHLEHLDERLEVWYQSAAGQRLDLVDVNRLPFGLSSPEALASELRMFGPGEIRVLGNACRLAPLHAAVLEVSEAAECWLEEHRGILDDRRM